MNASICVLSLADLSWLFEPKLENMLFMQKIDFDYENELVDCLYVKAGGWFIWYDPCQI